MFGYILATAWLLVIYRLPILSVGKWGVGGWTPSLCLQTPIFEWKSAWNFNLWAKFQTFRQL